MIIPTHFNPTVVSGIRVLAAAQLNKHFDVVQLFELRLPGLCCPSPFADKESEARLGHSVQQHVERLFKQHLYDIEIAKPVQPQIRPVPAFYGDIIFNRIESTIRLSQYLVDHRMAVADPLGTYRWQSHDSEELKASLENFGSSTRDGLSSEQNWQEANRIEIPDLPEDW